LRRGAEPPATKHEIISLSAKEFGLDQAPFDKIFDIRENKSRQTLSDSDANQLFGEYMEQIEKVIESVDTLHTGEQNEKGNTT
jgi:hypothetical protein